MIFFLNWTEDLVTIGPIHISSIVLQALNQAKSLYAEYKRQFDEYDKELKNIEGQKKSNEKAGHSIHYLEGQ
jgi:hypothetical protein